MFGFYKYYFAIAISLFAVEFFIGFYMHDAIIRPFGGDFLVVILMYCMVKSFFNTRLVITSCGVLLFFYAVEISQYFHLVQILGWEHSKTACIIMGTYFSYIDLICYTLGILTVILIEKMLAEKQVTKPYNIPV